MTIGMYLETHARVNRASIVDDSRYCQRGFIVVARSSCKNRLRDNAYNYDRPNANLAPNIPDNKWITP